LLNVGNRVATVATSPEMERQAEILGVARVTPQEFLTAIHSGASGTFAV
jgi:predicted RNA-binding protein with EMAP domain